jgi:hypothetical protein
MARTRTSLVALALFGLTACGGTTATGGGGTTVASRERPPYTPCANASEVRLAPTVCWNPTGSRWHVQAQAPGGLYEFDIELMAGGRVRSTDVTGASPATDEWFVENDVLRIFLQNRYVEYRATLHNGTLLSGNAENVRGDQWVFRADRLHHGGSCPANELVAVPGDEPGCFGVAGTRWTVTAGAESYEVQFAEGGHLLTNRPTDTTPDDDGWDQTGGTVRFWFDSPEQAQSGTIATSLAQISGSGWTAAPIPSYPPPIH